MIGFTEESLQRLARADTAWIISLISANGLGSQKYLRESVKLEEVAQMRCRRKLEKIWHML